MVFVSEVIPDEFRKFFDFRIFKDLHDRPFQVGIWRKPKWTIDRARNIFLIEVGTDFDRDRHLRFSKYALYEDGKISYFFAEEVLASSERGSVLTWDNVVLEIPETSLLKQDKTVSILKHAIRAHGLNDEMERIIAVHINVKIIIEGTGPNAWKINPYSQTSKANQINRHAPR